MNSNYFSSGSTTYNYATGVGGRWASSELSVGTLGGLRARALTDEERDSFEERCVKRTSFELARCAASNAAEKQLWSEVKSGLREEPPVFVASSGKVRSIYFALEGYSPAVKDAIIKRRLALSRVQRLEQKLIAEREYKEERKQLKQERLKRENKVLNEKKVKTYKAVLVKTTRIKKVKSNYFRNLQDLKLFIKNNEWFAPASIRPTGRSVVEGEYLNKMKAASFEHYKISSIMKIHRVNRGYINDVINTFASISKCRVRRFNKNYDRATAMGKTDPGPIDANHVLTFLVTITKYEEVVELRKMLPHVVSSKLRLLPSQDLNAKLSHLASVLTLAASKGDNLVGIEGVTEYGTKTDFDLLYRTSDTELIAVDVTNDPSLLESKTAKINTQAKKLQAELKEIGHEFSIRGVVHVPLETHDFNVTLPADKFSLWETTYKIIDSITPENLEDCKTAARMFLDSYSENLDTTDLPPEKTYKITEDAAVKIARNTVENNVASMEAFMSMRDSKIPFVQECAKTASKLAYQYNTSLVKTWELKLDVAKAKHDKVSFISEKLLVNDVLFAINELYRMKDRKHCYKISRGYTIKVQEPKEIFASSDCILIGKYQGDFDYQLWFNKDMIDENLRLAILRKHSHVDVSAKTNNPNYFLKDVTLENDLTTPERDNENVVESLYAPKSTVIVPSIITKLTAIVESNSRIGIQNIDGALSESVNQLLANYNNMPIFNIIQHEYEIAKSFAVTLNFPKKSHSYRVCFNGNYESVTIRQNNAPLDAFTNAFYFTIYAREDTFLDSLIKAPFRMINDTIQTQSLSFNRNTLSWELKKIYTIIMLSSWLIENKDGATSNVSLMNKFTIDAYRICTINRNAFAVASEQTRYFYVSTTGRCSDPSAIIKKLGTFSPRYRMEVVYLIRQLKMAAFLYLLRSTNNLGQIATHDNFGNRILRVAFPHETSAVPDFNYSISAFYVCNVFNKFKYNVSTSEALCFQGLLEEDAIFKEALTERENEVIGISPTGCKYNSFLSLITENINDELDFALSVSRVKSKRYSFSLAFILSVFLTRKLDYAQNPNAAHNRLSLSPADSCTLRGGMSDKTVLATPQSVRAATVFVEGILDDYGKDPKRFNSSLFYRQDVIEELAAVDVSTETLACNNYNNGNDYCYRIVHKDQKGEREISVLNYAMRIGAKFVEESSRSIAFSFRQNVLENPDKGIVMSKVIEETKAWKTASSRLIYDNNDQQRWGPNHMTVTFYALLSIAFVNDRGIRNVLRSILKRFEHKFAKYPESLIDKVNKDQKYRYGTTMGDFTAYVRNKLSVGIASEKFEWGMCQGILHVTSSLYHAAIADYIEEFLLTHKIVENIRTLVTSDDGFRAMKIEKRDNLAEQLAQIQCAITKISSAANIIRSPAKSTFNTIVGEFNSDFYVAGDLYTPNLKQRISKIEAGSGEDFIDDMCTVLSSALQYFTSGGTYFGSYLLQCVNVCQVTEQFRRWYQYKDVKSIDKSVLLGGIPLISPMITLMSGPVSNIFVKDLYNKIATPETIALYFAAIANSSSERITQEEILRGNTSVVKDLDFTYFQSVSLSGFISLTKPHKQASRFERRHNISKILLPEDWISLSSSENSFNSLILSVSTGSGSKTYEELLGTNTYISRFAESYVNIDALRFRVGKTVPSSKLIGGAKMSLRAIEEYYETTDNPYSERIILQRLASVNEASITPLVKLIVDNITNAHRISMEQEGRTLKVIRSGQCPSFKICKLATNRISVIDSESFRLSVFKSSYSLDSGKILRNMGYLPSTISNLPELKVENYDSLIEAVKYTKNVVDSYAKYLKHKTKGVFKALRVNRDLFEMAYNACYLNLSGLLAYKPPKVELPTSGKVIRICRLATESSLSESVTKFSLARGESIFQSAEHIEPPSHLCDSTGNSLGVFETLPAGTRQTNIENDSLLLINKSKPHQIHRKLDILIPTETNFRFSGRVIRNIKFSSFCDNSYCRFNGLFLRSVKETRAPVRAIGYTTIGYCIRKYNGTYRHVVYVTPDAEITRTSNVTLEALNNNKYLYPLVKAKLGLLSTVKDGNTFSLSDKDSLQVIVITDNTKLSLTYSLDSMIVSIRAKGGLIPYTALPLHPIEQFQVSNPTAVRLVDFRRIRTYLEGLFRSISDTLTASTDDEDDISSEVSYDPNINYRDLLAEKINQLELPVRMENLSNTTTDIAASFACLHEMPESTLRSILGNSTTFVFMLIVQFKTYFNYKSLLTKHLRRNNFCKSSDEKLFEPRQSVSILTEAIPFEEQEKQIEEAKDEITIDDFLDMDFYDDDDEEDLENELDAIADDDAEGLRMSLKIPESEPLSLATAEPVLDTVSSILEGSLFETYEPGEDDLEEVELHGSKTWSVYDNMSDRNYINNARALLRSMVPECSQIFREIRNPATLVSRVSNMHGGDRQLSELYTKMSKYMSLDRLCIVFLCFEFSV